MANLKELKIRIGSVKNTQKITKAMKMVAASKLRRAQERAEGTRPYSRKLQQIIQNLSESIVETNRPELLSGRKDESGQQYSKKHLMIVTSSDKGLCGGFNSSLIKGAKKRIEELVAEGKEIKVISIGKKAREVLKSAYEDSIVSQFDAAKGKQVEFEEADDIAKLAIGLFEKGEVDSVELVFARFVNPLVQTVTFRSLIPLEISDVEANDNKEEEDDFSRKKEESVSSVYEYEPDEETILRSLLPKNISVQIYRALLENSASEQGARMTAMDNATKNASEMINKLTLEYNRTRQAAITTELTEIVAGAEAV